VTNFLPIESNFDDEVTLDFNSGEEVKAMVGLVSSLKKQLRRRDKEIQLLEAVIIYY